MITSKIKSRPYSGAENHYVWRLPEGLRHEVVDTYASMCFGIQSELKMAGINCEVDLDDKIVWGTFGFTKPEDAEWFLEKSFCGACPRSDWIQCDVENDLYKIEVSIPRPHLHKTYLVLSRHNSCTVENYEKQLEDIDNYRRAEDGELVGTDSNPLSPGNPGMTRMPAK